MHIKLFNNTKYLIFKYFYRFASHEYTLLMVEQKHLYLILVDMNHTSKLDRMNANAKNYCIK